MMADMETSTESFPAGVECDGPFDDYAFINLCASGQIDNLSTLLDVETRYIFSRADCDGYRHELDTAAGDPVVEESSSSNTDWRYRIARWMLRVSDEFSINRETATIALSYCDRFLLGKKISRHRYQIVAITCLFIASKLFEKRPIKMTALMDYTQGKFDRNEVVSMEEDVATSIGSYMYPPTASTFVLMLLNELSCTSSFQLTLLESCQFMIELATCDFFFLAHKQSKLAVASIIVAMEQMDVEMSSDLIRACLSTINIKPVIDISDDSETTACMEQLRKIYSHNEKRIKSIDGSNNNGTTTVDQRTEQCDRKRICRAATPSPTPEEMQEHEADIGVPNGFYSIEGEGDIQSVDGGRRKRQRYENN